MGQLLPDSVRKYHCYLGLSLHYLSKGEYLLADSLAGMALSSFQVGARDKLIMARIKARINDTATAIHYLRLAALNGMELKNITKQTEFEHLQKTVHWQNFLKDYQGLYNQYHCNLDMDQVLEIRAIDIADQLFRRYYSGMIGITKMTIDDVKRMDSINLSQIKKYIKKYGFPKINQVGYRTLDGFYAIILHCASEYNKEFSYIDSIMKLGLYTGDFSPIYYSGVLDFHNYKNTRFEVYSSAMTEKDSFGNYILRPIENIRRVDLLRCEIGLVPLYFHMATWKINILPNGYYFDERAFRHQIDNYCGCAVSPR